MRSIGSDVEAYDDWCDQIHGEPDGGQEEYEPVPIPDSIIDWSVKASTVGPQSDPYHRVQYSVTVATPYGALTTVTLRECALAGPAMWVNGEELHFGGDAPEWDEAETSRVFDCWFYALTGVDPLDLDMWEYDRTERGFEIREAEIRAGWDATP